MPVLAKTGREAVKVAERLVDEQGNVSIFARGVGRGVECAELERIIAVCGADKARRLHRSCPAPRMHASLRVCRPQQAW